MQHLGTTIAENLKRLRAERALSLDALSKLSGVSRSRLSQMEAGDSNPSVTTIWQVANALKVEFSALVTSAPDQSVVVDRADAKPIVEDAGRYRVFPLFTFDALLGDEVYDSELDPGGRLHAEPHGTGAWETILVASGELTMLLGGDSYRVGQGQAMRFEANQVHEYSNDGDTVARFYIILAYPKAARGA